MTITLTRAQLEWLEAEVAAGRFASVDEAAQAIIAERMAEQPEAGDLDLDDLDWAKPLLDEAREDVARGRTVTLEEFNSQIDKIRAELRK
jgi:antitoxin ParD1/3/4